MDNSYKMYVVLYKASNTLDHQILQNKLEIKGDVLNLVENYLTHIKHYVETGVKAEILNI